MNRDNCDSGLSRLELSRGLSAALPGERAKGEAKGGARVCDVLKRSLEEGNQKLAVSRAGAHDVGTATLLIAQVSENWDIHSSRLNYRFVWEGFACGFHDGPL
jgi:hypothetical protein